MPVKVNPTTGIKERPISVIEMFAAKYEIVPSGCWVWQGYKNSLGYGSFRSRSVHRQMWELVGNKIDVTKQLDHLCRNPSCLNPEHLEQVTARVNTLRGNTVTADNAKKTYCKHGHTLSDGNLIIKMRNRPGNRVERVCRECRNRLCRINMRKKATLKSKGKME